MRVAILPEGGYRSYEPSCYGYDNGSIVAILPEGGYRSYIMNKNTITKRILSQSYPKADTAPTYIMGGITQQ